MNDMKNEGMKCGRSHHSFLGVLVVLFALTFLLGTFDVLTARTVSVVWPVLVGIYGVLKMRENRCSCC
ncbi:MAG: hypothetical protein A2586_01975 [Candidatus Harrisonbacteria bacterium RIFOXYD1_FULL_40_9]|uniref:DUF5668 domain-containing protein n=1 Tax=Candidatus Harrisonbacteria bacterium RIFOXYD1_FULL_40_9 TaxID=1798412 RepID=A0A1G1ZW03_9BACT|nr:MAG: hypothetical protein A2586_01975 [Candidatus Harrisonbacteria bacterium RIFOXYD1_FULL_40_9]